MKKLLGISFLLVAIALPALAQQWHLSGNDQSRFDDYFSRWQDYRQRNDRDQIVSMEKRMQDIYSHYNIPSNTPYWRVASNARRGGRRFNLSANDQARFDNYFSRWQQYQQSNDRDQVRSMEGRMQDIYRHYNIPSGTPYFMVASNARDEDWDRWDRDRAYHGEGNRDADDHDRDRDRDRDRGGYDRGNWHGRLSANDQSRFDSYYSRWLNYRRDNNRDQVRSMEQRMYGIYDNYRIPHNVGFDQVASH
jgi:hypothetical protein